MLWTKSQDIAFTLQELEVVSGSPMRPSVNVVCVCFPSDVDVIKLRSSL
jgi:hypothetical protein